MGGPAVSLMLETQTRERTPMMLVDVVTLERSK
jgi:hypothetical protein